MTGFAARTSTKWTTSVGLGALVALFASGQALAASTWTDPAGDALFHAPAYADVIGGTVNEADGTFEFTMTVAEAIPATPKLTAPVPYHRGESFGSLGLLGPGVTGRRRRAGGARYPPVRAGQGCRRIRRGGMGR